MGASVICVALCGCGAASRQAGANELLWAPPSLTSPTKISLGDGYTDTVLGPSQDAIITLPKTPKEGGVTIEGGHNIVLIGGEITVPSGAPLGPVNNRFHTGLYIKGATGTVHIEGVRFDAASNVLWDAIDINAPKATVQLENIRAEHIEGNFTDFHADVVQPWGGVKDLRIDRLTASSDYQGLTIPIDKGPIGSAELSHVDLYGLSDHVQQKGGYLLWLTSGTKTCTSYPVTLQDVYVTPSPKREFGKTLWPDGGLTKRCDAHVRHGTATWPGLPEVRGDVRAGPPPNGEYVPPDVAGIDYVSPGYGSGANN